MAKNRNLKAVPASTEDGKVVPLTLSEDQMEYVRSLHEKVREGENANVAMKAFLEWFRKKHKLPEKWRVDMSTGAVLPGAPE